MTGYGAVALFVGGGLVVLALVARSQGRIALARLFIASLVAALLTVVGFIGSLAWGLCDTQDCPSDLEGHVFEAIFWVGAASIAALLIVGFAALVSRPRQESDPDRPASSE